MAKASRTTRFERVRQILDRAAGDSAADYGGLGRFWNLPFAELAELRLHGVRLIAPPGGVHACCAGAGGSDRGSSGEAAGRGAVASAAAIAGRGAAEAGPCPGRGAASGLVQGLRAEPPFDGTRFPRLPWGGQAVAEEDILFISDWIDDGLPESDREIASFPVSGKVKALAGEATRAGGAGRATRAGEGETEDVAGATHTAETGGNEYAYEHGELRQRVNLDCMSEAQVERLRVAFRELYQLNKWPADRRSYNNLAQIHQDHCQHGWERFLPWHRVYLYEFEQALQDLCPDVTLPYWDWVMPQYCPRHPELGQVIPRALQAYLTPASIEQLEAATPPLPAKRALQLERAMLGKRYATLTGFFAAVKEAIGAKYTKGEHRDRFIDALLAANALWYPLRYPGEYQSGGKPSTINKVIHYHYPKPEDIEEILGLRTFRDFGGGSLYNDSFGFLDQNPHNTMHIWTGGMNPQYKAPRQDFQQDLQGNRNRGVLVAGRRFHTREDMYRQPENGDMFSNLTASYDPIFWPIHSNVDRLWWEWQQLHPQSLPTDLDAVLTPWSYTIADTLEIHRFGYEYVRSTCVVPVGTGAPVGRFVSKPIAVAETVRSFQQAEVRLHRVPQLPRSCFIRVFLNLPDADAETSIEDPHFAGYLAVFGHGACIGGPGHCEPPPGRRRKYDLRPRSHDTPRNHRVNVTRTARRLLDEGAKSLQIALVVIGADYCAENELLRLEGVSLNFLD
jgi:tyrosinase